MKPRLKLSRSRLRMTMPAIFLCAAFVQVVYAQSPATAPRETAAVTQDVAKDKKGADLPKPQVIDVDAAADPERAWARFLETAEFGPSFAAYQVLSDLPYANASVDADGCVRHREALTASVRAVPVSIALRRAAMLCAEVLGDAATAERELAALSALSKHALLDHSDLNLAKPIRVFQTWDMYALIHSLGYEFRYEYFKRLRPDRYFPHAVAAWDPEKKVEHHFVFDYVDTAAALDRNSPAAAYPYHRSQIAKAYVQSLLESDEPIAHDYEAVRQALSTAGMKERAKLLRDGAERGGLLSLGSWFKLCDETPFDGCVDGFVDALLPQAEEGHALAMTLLAAAYHNGVGLKKDTSAAAKMLAAANARWHANGASILYVAHLQDFGKRLSADNDSLLRAAAAAGHREAELFRLMFDLYSDAKRPLNTAEIAILERPENNRSGIGLSILAGRYGAIERNDLTWETVRKAAYAGSAPFQYVYADYLLDNRTDPESQAEAQALMIRAAHGGDADAARYLSARSANKSDWAAAASWLQAAVEGEDVGAILDLVGLIEEEERPGINGKPEDAYETYRRLSELSDSAAARRGMARMALRGVGTQKDPAKAKAWLLVDAKKGDLVSQVDLATALLNGKFGVPDIPEGESWMKRAISAGSEEATVAYGSWLIKHAPDTASRARGRKLLAEGKGADNMFTRNNLAWALCVSPHVDVREPVAGLAVAKRMEAKIDDLGPGDIDTIAACYAANGDFARAIVLQDRVLAGLPKNADGEPQGNSGLFRRLEMYKAKEAYIEISFEENQE